MSDVYRTHWVGGRPLYVYITEFSPKYQNSAIIVQLMKTKCLPVLYYAPEACPLNKSEIKALDYILFSSFGKIYFAPNLKMLLVSVCYCLGVPPF